MMLQMFGAFAEFERNIIRERSIAGQKAARDRGRAPGRRRSLSCEKEAELVRLYLERVMNFEPEPISALLQAA